MWLPSLLVTLHNNTFILLLKVAVKLFKGDDLNFLYVVVSLNRMSSYIEYNHRIAFISFSYKISFFFFPKFIHSNMKYSTYR